MGCFGEDSPALGVEKPLKMRDRAEEKSKREKRKEGEKDKERSKDRKITEEQWAGRPGSATRTEAGHWDGPSAPGKGSGCEVGRPRQALQGRWRTLNFVLTCQGSC